MNKKDKGLLVLLSSAVIVLMISIVLAVSMYNAGLDKNNGTIEYIPGTTHSTMQNITETTTVLYNEAITKYYEEITVKNTENSTITATTSSTHIHETIENTTINMSVKSDSEILAMLTDAVNKTKAYTGDVTVKHIETFDANVTECTGGSLVATAANSLVGMVLDPTNEALSFSNGTAQNADGESVTILLPQKGNFTLSINGIKSISASKKNDETVIYVTLVEEAVGLNNIPIHNASGVGYLDISSLDLSILEITHADIVYSGSVIEAHIRPDGYISYAKYTIPMHVEGSAKSGIISGSAVFDGKQTEIWQFEWH